MRTAIIGLVCCGLLLAGMGAAGGQATQGTVSGISLALEPEMQQEYQQTLREFSTMVGADVGENATVLLTDERRVIVSTDSRVRTGKARYAGTLLELNESLAVMFADSATYKTTGERISLSEYRENRDQYTNQVVTVNASYRQVAYSLETVARSPETAGLIGPPAVPAGNMLRPGRAGRFAALNLSGQQYDRNAQLEAQLDGRILGSYVTGRGETRWWQSGRADISLAVVELGGEPVHYLADVEPHGEPIDSLAAVQERGNELAGERVTVTTSGVGSRISTRETLIRVSDCGGEAVTIPASPPFCSPVPTDGVVHAGVLADGSAAVPYAGVSNVGQDTAVTTERGEWKVTGRVVHASEIDPRLEGYALLVEDRERVGTVDPSVASETIEAERERVESLLREQVSADSDEWQSIQQQAQQTPTATPTATPTSTPTASPTATGTPEPTPTPADYGENDGEVKNHNTPDEREDQDVLTGILTDKVRKFSGFVSLAASIGALLSGVVLSSVAMIQNYRGAGVGYSSRLKDTVWASGLILGIVGAAFLNTAAGIVIGGLTLISTILVLATYKAVELLSG
ncbi:hypothetical protein [Halomicrobium salinisoli]|uniref:hypothetical protein n=1 Tax=Halomicrobium salinisoli TaxID=2878391 RepID=UPI001CF05CDE|nr:hypothetical protein [Halomicrobium salinisoli]